MKYDAKEIGKRIKTCRKEYRDNTFSTKSPSQADFAADYLFIKRGTLSSYENGHQIPPLDMLLRMCELFDCELGYLLCEYDTKTRVAADIKEETGLSENSINVLRKIVTVYSNPLSKYFLIPPLIPFMDKLISDGFNILDALRELIEITYQEEQLQNDPRYAKYKELYEEFKGHNDSRIVFRHCMTDYGFDFLDADIDLIYDILNGNAKQLRLFTIQSELLNFIQCFIEENKEWRSHTITLPDIPDADTLAKQAKERQGTNDGEHEKE